MQSLPPGDKVIHVRVRSTHLSFAGECGSAVQYSPVIEGKRCSRLELHPIFGMGPPQDFHPFPCSSIEVRDCTGTNPCHRRSIIVIPSDLRYFRSAPVCIVLNRDDGEGTVGHDGNVFVAAGMPADFGVAQCPKCFR